MTAITLNGDGSDNDFQIQFSGSDVNYSGPGISGSTPLAQLESITINGMGGNDSLQIIGRGSPDSGIYLPSASNSSNGSIWANGRLITLSSIEGTIDVSNFRSFTYTTPGAADSLEMDDDQGAFPARNRIYGSSGSHGLPDVVFSEVSFFTLDAASSETTATADSLSVYGGLVASNLVNFEFRGGGGGDEIAIYGGTYWFDADAGDGTSGLSLYLEGATVAFNNSQHLGSLTLAGSTVTLAAGGPEVIVTKSLSIDSTSTLDLADNAMIVDYTGSAAGNNSPATTIRQYLINGRGGTGVGNATWSGSGGISSSAIVNAGDMDGLALGYREAQPPDFDLDPVTIFAGQSVDDTAILIRFTYTGDGDIGDANLDGVVDRDDLLILQNSFNQTSGVDWLHGDFDYNGVSDRDDLNLLSGNFGNNPGIIFSAASSAIEGQAFYLTLGDSAGSATSTLVDWGDGIQYPLGAIGASTTLEHEFIGAPALYTISITTDSPPETKYKHVFVRPAAPTDLTFIVRSTGEIDVNWGDDPLATHYIVYESFTSPVAIDADHVAAVQDHSSYIDVYVEANTTYYYSVTVLHSDGTETVLAADRAATTPAADGALTPRSDSPTPDGAPSHLRAEGINEHQILLTWQDNTASEARFEIQVSTDGGVTWTNVKTQRAHGIDPEEKGLVEPNDVTYTLGGLNVSTPYYFRLRAVNFAFPGFPDNTEWSYVWGNTLQKPAFPHIIILLGGHFQDQRKLEAAHTGPAAWPQITGDWSNGIGALWRVLWKEHYNVYLFEEYDSSPIYVKDTRLKYDLFGIHGPAWDDDIFPALTDGIHPDGENVAVIGYSHGGGMAYHLIGRIRGVGGTDVDYCGLIDAVERGPSDNWPPGALTTRPAADFVQNFYELNGAFLGFAHGDSIPGANDQTNVTNLAAEDGGLMDHVNIDDQKWILIAIRDSIHSLYGLFL